MASSDIEREILKVIEKGADAPPSSWVNEKFMFGLMTYISTNSSVSKGIRLALFLLAETNLSIDCWSRPYLEKMSLFLLYFVSPLNVKLSKCRNDSIKILTTVRYQPFFNDTFVS